MSLLNNTINNTFKKADYSEFLKVWMKGIQNEIYYWDRYFQNKGFKKEHYDRITNTNPPFLFPELLTKLPKQEFYNVLDVGSGPVSTVGFALEKITINLQACDPLALFYETVLIKHAITPYIKTRFALVERLSDVYPDNSFDLVSMENALDHSFSPLIGITELLRVVKKNGIVRLSHAENEGEFDHYQNFRQWNFTEQDNNFIIWKDTIRLNISELFQEYAMVEVKRQSRDNGKRQQIIVTFQKTSEVPKIRTDLHSTIDSTFLLILLDQQNLIRQHKEIIKASEWLRFMKRKLFK